MKSEELSYWVALNELHVPKNYFKVFGKIRLDKNQINKALGEIKWCQDRNVKIIRIIDEGYPSLLKEISDPPPILYVKGDFPELSHAMAIVGTRQASPYGLQVTEMLATEFAQAGVPVISGGALGIDQKAHEVTLYNRGKTVAVLGSGLARIYPKRNVTLFKKISETGALVSEFSPSCEPFKFNFPRRNRLISGLSRGVVIVEAPQKSGALITADFALEQGKDVFTVPGSIFSKQSKGCHDLLRQGAKPVFSIQDILDEYPKLNNSLTLQHRIGHSLSSVEKNILDYLSEPKPYSQLVERFDTKDLSNILLSLQMRGWVAERFNQYYRRRLCQNH